MPELTLTIKVPTARFGHAIAVLGAAGFVADPRPGSAREGTLALRTWFEDTDEDAETMLALLALELLAEEGIRGTVRSSGLALSSGVWRQVFIDGRPSSFRVIGANDEEWNAQLDYLAEAGGEIARDSLSLRESDDPYRRLLERG